jgi:transposase InsO family protein
MRVGKKRAELVKQHACKTIVAEAVGIGRHHIHRTSKLDAKDAELKTLIEETWKTHKAYGHIRLGLELSINHKRTRRVMRKFGIHPPRRKVSHFCTKSTSHHAYYNLIKEWKPSMPNELWCSDVSFIKYEGRFWYLATIEDIVTRQVIAVQVGKYHNSQLILTTIKQAIQKTGTVPKVFHTDQGTEFMAKLCTDYLENLGVNISASDKGCPWQNGFQESLFGRFKDEFGDFSRFDTVSELIEEIYGQVRYYNEDRIHRSLKMSPARYAKKLLENPRHEWGT